MKKSNLAIFIILLVLLQLAVLPSLNLERLTPNLILAAVVWATFYLSSSTVLPIALVGGLLLDLYSGGFLGHLSFSLISVAASLRFLLTRFFSNEAPVYLLAIAAVFGQVIFFAALFILQSFLSVFNVWSLLQTGNLLNWTRVFQLLIQLFCTYAVGLLGKKLLLAR